MERFNKRVGIATSYFAAFTYGCTPIFAKLSYGGGSNLFIITFFRGLIAMPVLFTLLYLRKIPLAINKAEAKALAIIGTIGSVGTTMLLYSSYEFIPVGIATTLHFVYPACVTLTGALLFKQKIALPKWVALGLVIAGVAMFIDVSPLNPVGVLFAIGSGMTYSFFMLGVENTALCQMHPLKLSLYMCTIKAVVIFLIGLPLGQLAFQMTLEAWIYTIIVAVLVQLVGSTLILVSIKYIGASTVAMISTLEPITSIVMGMLILNEWISPVKILGCTLILAGIVIVTMQKSNGKILPGIPEEYQKTSRRF